MSGPEVHASSGPWYTLNWGKRVFLLFFLHSLYLKLVLEGNVDAFIVLVSREVALLNSVLCQSHEHQATIMKFGN